MDEEHHHLAPARRHRACSPARPTQRSFKLISIKFGHPACLWPRGSPRSGLLSPVDLSSPRPPTPSRAAGHRVLATYVRACVRGRPTSRAPLRACGTGRDVDDWEALGEDDIVLPVRPAREPDADPADWTTASTEAAPKTDAREQVAVKKDLSEPRPMIIVDMTVMERVPRAHRALCAHSCRLPRVDPAHVTTALRPTQTALPL